MKRVKLSQNKKIINNAKKILMSTIIGSMLVAGVGGITKNIKHKKNSPVVLSLPFESYEPLIEDNITSGPIKVCLTNMSEQKLFQEKVGELALELALNQTYVGRYKYSYDDCYDFLTKVAWAVKYRTHINNVRKKRWNGHKNVYALGWNNRIQFNRKQLDIQTGDFIYVVHSPVSYHHTHWGVCIRINNEIYVVHKISSRPTISTLDWFIRNCKRDRYVKILRNNQTVEEPVVVSIPSLKDLAEASIKNDKL